MGCKATKFDSLGTQYRFPINPPSLPPPPLLQHRKFNNAVAAGDYNKKPVAVVLDLHQYQLQQLQQRNAAANARKVAAADLPSPPAAVSIDEVAVDAAMDTNNKPPPPPVAATAGQHAGGDHIVDTQPQTQSQSTNAWTNIMDSQPIEAVVWGRLYPKSVKVKSLDLCRETFAAGRDEGNELCLTKRELPEKILCRISKVHFRISKDLGEVTNPVYIQDLSRNGTFVNGEKIGDQRRQILLNDDVISLSHPQYKAFVYKDLSPNESHGLPRPISSTYHIGRKLGAGACGVVRLVYHRRTCEPYAMKHIRKHAQLTNVPPPPTTINGKQAAGGNGAAKAAAAAANRDAQRIANEGQIMRSLRHPCIVRMNDIIDCPDSVFIMLEVMGGGDLLSRIVGRKRLPERVAQLYMVQLCEAVKYLHDKNITHRDLKPDNILLQTDAEETLVKVSDFGLSKAIGGGNDSVMRTLCGTPLYVAPEVLLTGGRGSYTNKVDVWSLGVVLFTCLSGTLPFSDEYGTPASEQIKKARFAYRSPAWRSVSRPAKALIEGMLTVRAEKRLSIDEVLAHEWLQDEAVLARAERIMGVQPTSSMLKAAQREAAEVERKAAAETDVMAAAEEREDADAELELEEEMLPASMPLCMDIDVAVKCSAAKGGRENDRKHDHDHDEDDDHKMRTTPSPPPNSEDQENISANFLQPPAAKRRRIEQM